MTQSAQIPEERKELLPKCDICKVTIKRADTITVQCSGSDPKEHDGLAMVIDKNAQADYDNEAKSD